MKRRALYFISIIMTVLLAVFCVCGCTKDGSTAPGNNKPSKPDPDDPPTSPRSVYLKVNDGAAVAFRKQSGASDQTEIYTVKVSLAVGDSVTIYDNSDAVYANYIDGSFNGTAKLAGEHTFELRISGSSGVIYVTQPSKIPDPDPDPEPDPEPNPNPDPDPENPSNPKPTKTTVYFTNTNQQNWSNVYAYMWNSKVADSYKTAWPGDRLSVIGMSGFDERQYSVEVDITLYDRIIFNDNAGNKTRDLTVGAASSGYFGVDGMFTYGTDDYGKVEYYTLKDTKNLGYISSASKKFSVYTPRGYTKNKKYGVLYMFDSQNLYIGANGAEKNHDDYGSWAVDVAVNNLVSNGGDGVIIVAIDNTDGYRNRDLTMSQAFGSLTSLADESDYYDGHLDELGNFIKETLMPWVKNKYSIDDRREKTGIAGSSSGGLAAYYLGLRDNDLYGYIGAFSPANGLFKTSDWNKFYANKNFKSSAVNKPKIYVYCGENGDWLENMLLPATKEIKNLTSYGFAAADITENYVGGGTHSENYWRNAFAEFLSKYAW